MQAGGMREGNMRIHAGRGNEHADLHAASGQCSCPHMRAAFKLLAVQTTRRHIWASGGVATTAAAMHAISS